MKTRRLQSGVQIDFKLRILVALGQCLIETLSTFEDFALDQSEQPNPQGLGIMLTVSWRKERAYNVMGCECTGCLELSQECALC